MLLVIAGPSGSGKTTFIELVLNHLTETEVICVDVYSPYTRSYEVYLGKSAVSLETFLKKALNGTYSFINTYDKCRYGYNIPSECISSKRKYLLDYPGEYPECKELNAYPWIGILILPPSVQVLKNRLKNTNRSHRVKSAINEYTECLNDIEANKFASNWVIVITHNTEDVLKQIEEIQKNMSHSQDKLFGSSSF